MMVDETGKDEKKMMDEQGMKSNQNDAHIDEEHQAEAQQRGEASTQDADFAEGTIVFQGMTGDEIMNTIESLEKVKEENESLRDEMLRMRAEMENSKKRLNKHYDERSKERTKLLLMDVITLLDDFERAFLADNTEDGAQADSVIEGIKLIEAQFVTTLENKWRLTRFDSKETEFDPDKHEAMMREELEGIDGPCVLEEFSKGYMLDDKVLRPAKVKVGVPKNE